MKFTAALIFMIGTILISFASDARAEALFPYQPAEIVSSPIPASEYTMTYTPPKGKFPVQYYRQNFFFKRPYYLFAHPGLQNRPGKPPLILLLHSGNYDGASMADKWYMLAREDQFVIVAPDAKKQVWSITDGREHEYLLKLVDKVQQDFNTDPQRTYIFGHSSGAVMAIAMAAVHSDRFAAAAVHGGSLPVETLVPLVQNLRPGMPITFITGVEDPVHSIDAVMTTAETMRLAGAHIKEYEISNHNHWYFDIAEYINILAWNEMSKYALPVPQNTAEGGR